MTEVQNQKEERDHKLNQMMAEMEDSRVSEAHLINHEGQPLSFMAITSTSEVSQTNWWTVQIKSDEVF